MNNDELFAQLRRLWDNNQRLWDERVDSEFLVPLDARGGLTIEREEDAVAITALGPSMETFRAVQRLCDPRVDEAFWADGFVLTRSLFETFVTLEWIELDRKERAQRFQDDYVLKTVHFMKMVGEDQVRPEKRAEIRSQHDDVMRRRGCGPDKQSLLPSLVERAREVATKLPTEQPHLQWEYDMYYRDVSGFAHSSGWGMWSTLPRKGGPIELKANPTVGVKALMCNGAWFLRVIRVWNKVAGVLPDEQIRRWEDEWMRTHVEIGV
jgi:hypothetical protein